MTMNLNCYSIGFVAFGFIFSCKKNESSFGVADTQAPVLESGKWPNNSATVCWQTEDFAFERQAIRGHIEREYNSKTGFKFIGWDICDSKKPSQIRVNISRAVVGKDNKPTDNLGHSKVGTGLGYEEPSSDPFRATLQIQRAVVEAQNFHPAKYLNTALHEFGHALGMFHEHDRDDAEESCRKLQIIPGMLKVAENSIKRNGGVLVLTNKDFDKESVMNYCHLWQVDARGELAKLSTLDIASVNYLYPPSKNQPSFSAYVPKLNAYSNQTTLADKQLWKAGFYRFNCALKANQISFTRFGESFCLSPDVRLPNGAYSALPPALEDIFRL